MIQVSEVYGTVEPRIYYRYEEGAMVCYGYSVHRDREGKIVKITEPEKISRLVMESK